MRQPGKRIRRYDLEGLAALQHGLEIQRIFSLAVRQGFSVDVFQIQIIVGTDKML